MVPYRQEKQENFCCNYSIIDQIVESPNPAQDASSYTLKENKVEMFRPCYDAEMGEFHF